MALKTAVVYGSVRSARQGIRAARFIIGKLEARGHEVAFLDPLEKPLPLLDRMYKEFGPGEAPEPMEAIAAALRDADGFIRPDPERFPLHHRGDVRESPRLFDDVE